MLLVLVLTCIGCIANYMTSALLLSDAVAQLWPDAIASFRASVENARRQRSLLGFLVFLRLLPAPPAWLVNMAAPLVHVPFGTFAISSLLGFIPQVCVLP